MKLTYRTLIGIGLGITLPVLAWVLCILVAGSVTYFHDPVRSKELLSSVLFVWPTMRLGIPGFTAIYDIGWWFISLTANAFIYALVALATFYSRASTPRYWVVWGVTVFAFSVNAISANSWSWIGFIVLCLLVFMVSQLDRMNSAVGRIASGSDN
jgi:hypothetical protein